MENEKQTCHHLSPVLGGLGAKCGKEIEFLPEGNEERRFSGWHHADRDSFDHHAIPKGWTR